MLQPEKILDATNALSFMSQRVLNIGALIKPQEHVLQKS